MSAEVVQHHDSEKFKPNVSVALAFPKDFCGFCRVNFAEHEQIFIIRRLNQDGQIKHLIACEKCAMSMVRQLEALM